MGASWTDERIELLVKMWSDGCSAAEISRELGWVTRNAVIGKVHRLGLSRSSKVLAEKEKNNSTPTRSAPCRSGCFKPDVPAAPPKHSAAVAVEDEAVKLNADGDIKPIGVKLFDLLLWQCRWPLGDFKEKAELFCGHRRVESGRNGTLPFMYCAHHCRIAYRAPASPEVRERARKARAARLAKSRLKY